MSSETPGSRISLADTPALLTEQSPRAFPGWPVLVVIVILLVAGGGLLSRGLVERLHGGGPSGGLVAAGVLC